jgi:hypothetical protein
MPARTRVGPLGEFVCAAIGAARDSVERVVKVIEVDVKPVVLVTSTGVPSKSGTSVCEGPDAGGGTGAVRATAVVVEDVARVVVLVVVELVLVGVVGVVGVDGAVVVVGSGSGSVGTVCARAPSAPVARQSASALTQTQVLRRIASS